MLSPLALSSQVTPPLHPITTLSIWFHSIQKFVSDDADTSCDLQVTMNQNQTVAVVTGNMIGAVLQARKSLLGTKYHQLIEKSTVPLAVKLLKYLNTSSCGAAAQSS